MSFAPRAAVVTTAAALFVLLAARPDGAHPPTASWSGDAGPRGSGAQGATRRAPQTAPFLLDAPATAASPQRKSTPHLDLETWPVVDASRREPARLVVKVRPRAGMRLYAPGEQDYVGVAIVLDEAQPARLGPARLPAPSTYVFPPTGESNRVFSAPFTLEVPVHAKAGAGRQPERLTGRFEYQACDETLCYKPVRIPLSWRLGG
jgi:hypothetical protein